MYYYALTYERSQYGSNKLSSIVFTILLLKPSSDVTVLEIILNIACVKLIGLFLSYDEK